MMKLQKKKTIPKPRSFVKIRKDKQEFRFRNSVTHRKVGA
jgi:hypothetical protein